LDATRLCPSKNSKFTLKITFSSVIGLKIRVNRPSVKPDGKNNICVCCGLLSFLANYAYRLKNGVNLKCSLADYSLKNWIIVKNLHVQTQTMFLPTSFIIGRFTLIFKPTEDVITLFVFSLWPTHNIDKTHLHKIIFSMFLSHPSVKSPVTKKIENNILDGMTFRFYILLLFDSVFKF